MEETLIKRIMPNSLEAEQSVIGCMIMDRDAIVTASGMLEKDDFYHQQYGILFETITELFNSGTAVDVVTLQNRLREKNVPPEISSLEYVGDLVAALPTSVNVPDYARIVREKSILRKLIRMNESIADACYLQEEGVDDILEDTEKQVFNLIQNRTEDDFVPIRRLVMEALDRIEQAAKVSGSVTGLPTGFPDLDYMLAGLQKSDLVLVAARPSMGKTALALNIAQYVAFHEDEAVAIFSLEMSREQLVSRLLAMESRVDSKLIRNGNLTDADWEKLIEGADTVGGSKLIIDDTPGISVSELRSKCRKFKLEYDVKLIILDYLQLMSGSRRPDSRQQEISDISRSLKQLARELKVPVLALSQLSRQVEQRPDHRPMLSDLRESGAIEQDADVVMFIYRDDYYNKDSDQKGIAEISIAKQRNGPIGTVDLVWLPQYTKFVSMERDREFPNTEEEKK
ncbi:MAG: replicative DNA helicase [Lachnospiraceae bacterium]|nr:replicative DNA helicase [Lachnospiraceae bacterium]